MSYQGIFLRHFLGQTPSGPIRGSGWTNSPDIIPFGKTLATDPTIFTSESGYADPFGSTVFLNENNYVYVRGMNTTGGPMKARLWFYFVESNVVLWPQDWQSANVIVGGVQQNYMDIAAETANQIIVGSPPFQWKAPPLQGPRRHYCMIAFAENPPLSDPPQLQLPGFMSTWQQLGQFIMSHPNIAWRNTIDVSRDTPTWQETARVAGAPGGGQFYCGLQLTNLPTDGFYSFQVAGPDKQNSIVVGKTPITNPNANFTIPVTWPEKFASTITISYWKGKTAPPFGATITPVVMIPEVQLAGFLRREIGEEREEETPAAIAQARLRPPETFMAYDSPRMLNSNTIRVCVIGSMPYRFA